MRRRQLLGAAAALATTALVRRAHADSHFEVREVAVEGDRRIGDRFVLLVPKHDPGRSFPLLVLLHGLGETGDLRMGAHAWVERYGLGTAYQRLREAPVSMLEPKGRYFRPERLAEINRELAARPFRGMVIACPYTPNVYRAPDRSRLLDDYAAWVSDVVVPRARAASGADPAAASTHLNGCSLGGHVALELLLRRPDRFGGWGSVQGALGAHRLGHYAASLAALPPRPLLLLTSSQDDFREVNEDLSRKLAAARVAHDFVMPPGPHNQPFLRDSGTLEMLHWHDRKLG